MDTSSPHACSAEHAQRVTWHVDDMPWTPLTGLFIRNAGYKTVVDAGFTGNAYSIELTTVGPGGASPTHVEPHAHVFYVLSGQAEVTVGDEVTQMRPGSVSPIAAGVPHSFRNTGPVPLEMLVIYHPPRMRPGRADALAAAPALQLRIESVVEEAEDVRLFDLRPARAHEPLPACTAGAHIDVHLPGGAVRCYSVLNAQAERDRYLIAVRRIADGGGGSRFLHEQVRDGDILTTGLPRNHFELDEDAPHSVFIAGGIGITPLWSMVRRLDALSRPWELHYACRTRRHAALLERVQNLAAEHSGRIHLAFDHEPGGLRLQLEAIVAGAAPDTHLYCCGPAPMLQAFERATAARAAHTVHMESFAAREQAALPGGFEVKLARSGRTVAVPPGQSILQAVLDLGIDAPHSCHQGICGTCRVAVLSGIPEHRDTVLSRAEKEANRAMMICCSGVRSGPLAIDL